MATSFSAHGKRSYVAIKKEATAGTAVIPTNFVYVEDESLKSMFKSEVVPVSANSRSENYFLVAGENEAPTGDLTIPIQADTIGYFLAAMMGAPATTGPTDTTAYTHAFTSGSSGTIGTCTIEVGNSDAGYARRYCGARVGGLRVSQKSNVWYATLTPMARYSFVNAVVVGSMLAGATTCELDTNSGLAVGDVIKLGFLTANEENATLLTVNANGTTVTFNATSNTHADGVMVVLANRTPSYSTATPQYQWMGGTTTKYGTTLGGVAAATRFRNFNLEFAQKLVPEYNPSGTTDFSRYPRQIHVSTYGGTASFAIPHEDLTFQNYFRKRTDIALEMVTTGSVVTGASTAVDTLKFQIPKFRITDDPIPLGGNDIVSEQIQGMFQYSTSDAFDLKVTLINAIASYA